MATKTIALNLDELDIEHLKAEAAKYGVSTSAFARWVFAKDRGVSFSLPARFTEQYTKKSEHKEPTADATA
jgi:hypothetical protein